MATVPITIIGTITEGETTKQVTITGLASVPPPDPGYFPPGVGGPGSRPPGGGGGPVDPGWSGGYVPVDPGYGIPIGGNRPVDPGYGIPESGWLRPTHPIVIPPTEPPPTQPPPSESGNWVWAWSPQAGRWVWVKVPGEGEAGPKTT